MTPAAGAATEHPAPQRAHVRPWVLLAALAAGPFGWIVQLVVGYGVAGYACYPGDGPRLTPPAGGWGAEHTGLVALNLICLAVALAGGALSWKNWRKVRGEKGGGARGLLETGEGRTRFLATCGILAGLGFALAIAFNTAEPLVIASCWRIAP
ncbi:MAG: hypothetical protein ACR2FH_06160 [Caulobacteraceae bacterium]